MAYLPQLTTIQQTPLMTSSFLGLNRNEITADGETANEENMSSLHYPLMGTRKHRSRVKQIAAPQGMLGKDALCMVSGGRVYVNDEVVEGLLLNDEPKQLVSMGAYLCIWPDKAYVNTIDLRDSGFMAASFETVGSTTVQMCRLDGTDYASLGKTIIVSDTEPVDPEDGTLWIDSSGAVHVLKQYAASTESWQQVATTYVKISSTGIGANFKEYDSVTISGLTQDESLTETQRQQLQMLEGTMIVYAANSDYIVVAGIIDQSITINTEITLAREVPDLDYICESNNRLWGCRFGINRDGNVVNEIYASKLGDFRNWSSFMGLATDSYTVSVGSDGAFTGAVTLRGVPHFFKEHCVHKISGTAPSNYSMTTTTLRGVEAGSEKSMVMVGETLFYKGRTDILAYDGSLPTSISTPLGNGTWHNAVAGAYGDRYYISMEGEKGWEMYAWDTKRGVWHREDGLHALCFTQMDDSLYVIDADSNELLDINGRHGTQEGRFTWYAETGTFGYESENQKYLSRFNIRLSLADGAYMEVLIQYDSSGLWESQGTIFGEGLRTVMLPVIPRRCDHLRIKLAGKGDARIFSIARLYEDGGDGQWQ